MTDNKLTVNEIMTILEDCFPKDHRFITIYNGRTKETTCVTLQDILDAFNHQKAEIARLRSGYKNESQSLNAYLSKLVKKQKETIDKQEAEIERLQSMNQAKLDMIHDLQTDLETVQAEAVKEFWELLKVRGKERVDYYTPEDCSLYFSNGTLCGYVAMKEAGDSILKEMVSD